MPTSNQQQPKTSNQQSNQGSASKPQADKSRSAQGSSQSSLNDRDRSASKPGSNI